MSKKFKSKFEKEFFDYYKSRGIEYENTSFEYTATHLYTPDFTITKRDGSQIFIETKGYFRLQDMTKMRNVRDSNPDKDIRFVFMQDNKVQGRKDMRYSDWCKKYGFLYAFGSIPKEWFK